MEKVRWLPGTGWRGRCGWSEESLSGRHPPSVLAPSPFSSQAPRQCGHIISNPVRDPGPLLQMAESLSRPVFNSSLREAYPSGPSAPSYMW